MARTSEEFTANSSDCVTHSPSPNQGHLGSVEYQCHHVNATTLDTDFIACQHGGSLRITLCRANGHRASITAGKTYCVAKEHRGKLQM